MKNVEQVLEATGKITQDAIAATAENTPSDASEDWLWKQFVAEGVVTEDEVFEALGRITGIRFLDIKKYEIPTEAVVALESSFCRENRVVPLAVKSEKDDVMFVGMDKPENLDVLDAITATTKYRPIVYIVTQTALNDAINRYYRNDEEMDKLSEVMESTATQDLEESYDDLSTNEDDEPAVRFVNMLIAQAIQDRASDIHVEPGAKNIRVRYRIDGVLHELQTASKSIQNQVISRLKVMSSIDIAEKRKPQDGRMTRSYAGRTVDIRVATLPTVWGEKMVLRILDSSETRSTIESIGMSPENERIFRNAASKSQGMILVTGPTGSGKSTTLYTTLKHISDPSVAVITVEDPVEKRIEGIDQVQINNRAGSTFSNILKSILRSDPDIIFIGEVRDEETAEIAIKASMTGHLVLSTLHTNGAPEAVSRLVDMGVEPYLVSSSVTCVVAQRLARQLCDECKTIDENPDPELLRTARFDLTEDDVLYKAVGCNVCSGTGYRGRLALTEVMEIDSYLDHLIVKGATASELRKEAEEHSGMKSLLDDGHYKIRQGLTTLEEIIRVT